MQKVTGKALLQKVKQSNGSSRRELAIACGYFDKTKNGKQRANLTEFYEALMAAKGIDLKTSEQKSGPGREATYRAKVHKNGQLLIGAAYTEEMGFKPGDEFEIKLGYKNILLKKVEPSSDAVAA